MNQACLNGQGVNCNIYLDKRDVWLSGLPVSASLGAGDYFFAVLVPGGQPTPNDGGEKNLSDPAGGDEWTNRAFSVDGDGNITAYVGTHERDGNLLQLFPYDDTTNNGGVYILAVCQVPSEPVWPMERPGVAANDCKYDAFKIRVGDPDVPTADDPTIVKDAEGSYDNTYDVDDRQGRHGRHHRDDRVRHHRPARQRPRSPTWERDRHHHRVQPERRRHHWCRRHGCAQ